MSICRKPWKTQYNKGIHLALQQPWLTITAEDVPLDEKLLPYHPSTNPSFINLLYDSIP